jgi:hypothetical protein
MGVGGQQPSHRRVVCTCFFRGCASTSPPSARLLPAILATCFFCDCASFAIVRVADAHPPARPAVLLALAAPLAIVPADARPAALLGRASRAIVLDNRRIASSNM